MGPRAIIFDLGNVVIDFDYRISVDRISPFSDKKADQIFNLFFDSGLTSDFEEAKISPQQFFSQAKEILHLKIDYAEFVPIWNEIFYFSEKNFQVYDLACRLKKRYRVALLSNVDILHFEYIKKTFPILNAFHHIITSYEAGARKPKHLIYQKALDALGTPPQDTVYTDDRIELIESAKELGIRGFVFTSVQQLKKDFLETGVRID